MAVGPVPTADQRYHRPSRFVSTPLVSNPPTVFLILAWLTAVLAAVWMAAAFNRLVRHRNRVKEAWAGIDVQLARRHDLMPALVATVEGYASFEREVLERVTRLRARAVAGGPELRELQDVENQLASQIVGLIAVAEDYPELAADRSFLTLQQQLVEIEDKLQMARRYYNGAVRDHNTRVESFPSLVIAGLFGFSVRQFFEVESTTQRLPPRVQIGAEGQTR